MASEFDKASNLTRDLASMCTSEATNLYKEEKLPGKGIGCIALVDIKKGDIVLKETPQLLHPLIPEYPTHEETIRHYMHCVKAFIDMSKTDQKSYLELYNYFESDKSAWSSDMEQKYLNRQNLVKVMPFPNKEETFNVIAIMDTNGFHNGLCLKMSRFNHSCRPNAQYFWNEDTNKRDLRTLRNIKEGEEITVSYSPDLVGLREERRARLKEDFFFDCNCGACDLTEDEILEEADTLEKYKAEKQRREELQNSTKLVTPGAIAQALMQSELKCLKSMHVIAKEIKSFGPRVLLRDIIQEAFRVSAEGAAGCSKRMEATRTVWMQDAKLFADIGLKLATTLNGADHSMTKKWIESVADPVPALEGQPGFKRRAFDLTQAEVEEGIKKIDEYKKEKLRKKDFQEANKEATNGLTAQKIMRLELESLNSMYHIAEKIKTFRRDVFLKEIVEEAFDVSVQGALSAQQSVFMDAAKTAWMKEANKFANIGLQMAKKIYGAENSVTEKWKERSADPVNFFLNEFGGAMK